MNNCNERGVEGRKKSKKSINVEGGNFFCGGLNFSKSVNVDSTFIREMRVQYYETSGRLVFIRFLEELKTPKIPFKINWPLTVLQAGLWCTISFSICLENHQSDPIVFEDSQQSLTIYNYLVTEMGMNVLGYSGVQSHLAIL